MLLLLDTAIKIMIQNYKLIVAGTAAELSAKIVEAINNGWDIYGNVAIAVNSVTGEELFAQAVANYRRMLTN
jgi:hypothetical protein